MKSIPIPKSKQRVAAVTQTEVGSKVKAIRNHSLVSRIGSKSRWISLIYRTFVYVILIDLAFVFLYPFIYMVTTALKHPVDLMDFTIKWIPTSLAWENFYYGMKGLQFMTHFNNSALIAVLSVVGQVLSCSFVAYGFARIKFPGRELLFFLCMFTMIIPPQTIIVPLFMQYKTMGWLDSVMPLIVPSFFAGGLRGALFIFIFRQLFRGLPWELEDAARVDGCGSFKVYWKIILPLTPPAIVVTMLLSLVWHWNDFFEPSIFLTSEEKFTLPMMLPRLYQSLDTLTGSSFEVFSLPVVMAATFMALLPMLLVYFFLQRYFIQGVERSGLVE
ncbi:carbohydrate ABC transporter permease [Paenibacillus sp. CF384]|uniref:carbohydrate ABC transporter permease n=1 Tax=Paenibacillus sp. CF384 TaxID=1884382 RepID=UPI00089777C3|nr:carbohydrate ABC transporter permease [Paenibacillus sp. CF384]SDX06949.1 carbohydrate ABC transporter membrane protein 2, CUT1 family [Paenibacillus sp. CF384]